MYSWFKPVSGFSFRAFSRVFSNPSSPVVRAFVWVSRPVTLFKRSLLLSVRVSYCRARGSIASIIVVRISARFISVPELSLGPSLGPDVGVWGGSGVFWVWGSIWYPSLAPRPLWLAFRGLFLGISSPIALFFWLYLLAAFPLNLREALNPWVRWDRGEISSIFFIAVFRLDFAVPDFLCGRLYSTHS
jgi:hypothetical protein